MHARLSHLRLPNELCNISPLLIPCELILKPSWLILRETRSFYQVSFALVTVACHDQYFAIGEWTRENVLVLQVHGATCDLRLAKTVPVLNKHQLNLIYDFLWRTQVIASDDIKQAVESQGLSMITGGLQIW